MEPTLSCWNSSRWTYQPLPKSSQACRACRLSETYNQRMICMIGHTTTTLPVTTTSCPRLQPLQGASRSLHARIQSSFAWLHHHQWSTNHWYLPGCAPQENLSWSLGEQSWRPRAWVEPELTAHLLPQWLAIRRFTRNQEILTFRRAENSWNPRHGGPAMDNKPSWKESGSRFGVHQWGSSTQQHLPLQQFGRFLAIPRGAQLFLPPIPK